MGHFFLLFSCSSRQLDHRHRISFLFRTRNQEDFGFKSSAMVHACRGKERRNTEEEFSRMSKVCHSTCPRPHMHFTRTCIITKYFFQCICGICFHGNDGKCYEQKEERSCLATCTWNVRLHLAKHKKSTTERFELSLPGELD